MNSKKCINCGLVNFTDAEVCKRCGEKLLTERQAAFRQQQTTVQTTTSSAAVNRVCAFCGGALRLEQETTKEGQGCLFMILGLVFTPLLIGIPVLIYGFKLSLKREPAWRCLTCKAKA